MLKQLAISAQTVRNALKAEVKTAAEKRGVTGLRFVKIEDGKQSEVKELKAIDT